MKVKNFIELLSKASQDDEIYATDSPSTHKKAGGITIAAFQLLGETVDNKTRILSFTIMTGKQDKTNIVFRLEQPDWFAPP